MKNAAQTRILAIALAIATLAACALALINLQRENGFEVPTDGVTWVETSGGLQAQYVPAGSPGFRAGIRSGDYLTGVNDHPVSQMPALVRQMFRSGIWAHATYSILRPISHSSDLKNAARLDIQVILEPTDRSINQGLRFIALVYLFIGLYVLFRRWTAPKSTHFYVFCLVSFVLYSFKYTGELDTFDWIIYWGNIIAGALQPALFLHFAVNFSDDYRQPANQLGRRILCTALYLPGIFLIGLQYWALHYWAATGILRHRLDQISVAYLAFYYVIAAIVFWIRYRTTDSPLERQQLKWLTRGTLLAVTPFTLVSVPYLADVHVPSLLTKLAGLSLVFLPLTFSWAIVRYRLMDVDLIFKRGVTYTLATASLVGLYFGVVAVTAEMVHARLPSLRTWGLLLAIIVTGLIFDPLKRAIQARVDRMFDQRRFDYRETLIEFGRDLNSQTDLRALLDSIVERLPEALLVTRVAVFLAREGENLRSGQSFELAASHGLMNLSSGELNPFDLGFLDFDRPTANNHIFLENPQQVLRLPEVQRLSAARLDLNYYVPCRVANREGSGTRTVAVIGLGRTHDGDFLSSEEMEVLESLAGYIGIGIQNAQLYRRLEQKITDFERLKEFNENIVESINIGIFAVDLEDRVESWNAQMEVMFAKPRAEALRQPISALFPADFVSRFNSVREEQGTHTLYKFRLVLPTGESRVANIAIAPLVTRNFVTIGRIILVDDITDRIQMEAQLTQSEKLSSIGLLAAGVAHEVNTPLAVISSYAQMLTKHMRDDERLAPVLEKITQQTFRASEIVNGLLNFSRTSGSEFTNVDLNELLRDTLVLLEHQLKTAQIRVETNFDPQLPPIHGNRGKLQQVVLNLMLNAKDAMFGLPNSTLRIATFRGTGRVLVRIQDTGSGIEREHLNRIYDPFFTTKTKPQEGGHKGTGLGLAVTYGIMQEHAGKIHVESEVGVGTAFQLEFPVSAGRVLTPPIVAAIQESDRKTIHA
ncbi:GAF domain-containing sensor histidine kinase [Edaphobacter albus]|uniref:GAF domain-containing sensor histidine kinase n=1 Tax=Edaphobacter sp. 4G125 TaxID=2763071 RepID=UPI001645AE2A|nr:ATP-binding protein [Edaphobacter sp. 4G125]QNI35479.1 PAS domain-containing protein [Edaphobacter sp. 4G125]